MRRFTPASFQFDELRIATIVFVLMLLPVAGVIGVLELFVPQREVERIVAIQYEMTAAPHLRLHLLYLTSAVAHVIVSTLVIAFLKKGLERNISEAKRAAVASGVYMLIAAITALFLLCVYFEPVLAALSHERVYAAIKNSPLFSQYFVPIPSWTRVPGFYLFSVLPTSLIVLGLVVIVLACGNVGRDLAFVTSSIRARPTADTRRDIDLRVRSFHNYFYVLSSVLVTSTIATALFLKLPLTSIAGGDAYQAFDELSESYRVYRRAHSERGWSPWDDPASTRRSCVSAQSD